MNRRSHIAAWIGSLFVIGSLVMPFSHYVWMATSGHFDASRMHGSMETSADGAAIHGEHGQLCTYADLFASFASDIPQDASIAVYLPVSTDLTAAVEFEAGASHTLLPPLRGPPVV